jgi:hypothetical protein
MLTTATTLASLVTHSQSESPLFDEIRGDIAEDHKTYGFPSTALEPVPILFGPGLESQQTGIYSTWYTVEILKPLINTSSGTIASSIAILDARTAQSAIQ